MLPEWAETNQIGSCRILYGGFNPRWAAGALERRTVDSLAQQLVEQYPGQNITVVVPNWYEYQSVLDWIQEDPNTKVVACSLTDPISNVWYSNKIFGYGDMQFDFWAVACASFFKQYRYPDILPTDFKYLYLNYNRKPHAHRVLLVQAFESAGLVDLGCTTLSGTDYTVNDVDSDYVDSGARDIVGDIGIPNDIYSLGRQDIWQQSFLNIVSETQFDTDSTFLSEKTFKPIIGLRPFVINGNPKIYNWLAAAGFDCFEDIIPVHELVTCTSPEQSHKLIVRTVQQLADQDLALLYRRLLPRLINNQTHFYEYAADQQNKANNIRAFL